MCHFAVLRDLSEAVRCSAVAGFAVQMRNWSAVAVCCLCPGLVWVAAVVLWWKVGPAGSAVIAVQSCGGGVLVAGHEFPVQQQEVVQPSGGSVAAPAVLPQHHNYQWTVAHTHQGPETPTVPIKLEVIDT